MATSYCCGDTPKAETTALAILAARRDSPKPIARNTPTKTTMSFRDIFCSSLVPEPAVVSSPVTTKSTGVCYDIKSYGIPERGFETVQDPRCRKEDPKPNAVEHSQKKTLKDSRWAKEDHTLDKSESRPKTLQDSRWAREALPSVQTDKKRHNRNFHKRQRSTTQEPRCCGSEAPRGPPPVLMDREEFEREVAQYGLKTLKDSRWA
ncbi:hypothetical protein F4678DRAFT_459164 [Xylaria arbuscula]|nr:hypothetical protein F4678DRAFT_459164 [Xylaria arbuscula]